MEPAKKTALIRLGGVKRLTGQSTSAIYAAMNEGLFPMPVKLGKGTSVAWVQTEVLDWIEARIQQGRSTLIKRPDAPRNFLRNQLNFHALPESQLRSRADAYGIAWELIEQELESGLVQRNRGSGEDALWLLCNRKQPDGEQS